MKHEARLHHRVRHELGLLDHAAVPAEDLPELPLLGPLQHLGGGRRVGRHVRVDPEVQPALLRVAEPALTVSPLQLRATAVDDDAVQRAGLQPQGLQLRQDLAEPGLQFNRL